MFYRRQKNFMKIFTDQSPESFIKLTGQSVYSRRFVII